MKTLFDDYSDGNNRYWIGIRRKTETELENDGPSAKRPTDLSEHPTQSTYTPDTFAKTFPCIHAREKVTANVSVVSGEDIPPLVTETIRTYTWRNGLEKKGSRCSVKGCGRTPEWVNEHGEWPLCSVHYNEITLQSKRGGVS